MSDKPYGSGQPRKRSDSRALADRAVKQSKRPVATRPDDPKTPYYDARDDQGEFARVVCADCGDPDVVARQGSGDAQRAYCRRDRPANAR